MTTPNILFAHLTGSGSLTDIEYLHASLQQAHATNPESKIYLITDLPLPPRSWLTVVPVGAVCDSAVVFISKYTKPALNSPYWYLIVVFARLLMMMEAVRKLSIAPCVCVESDVLLFCEVTDLLQEHRSPFPTNFDKSSSNFGIAAIYSIDAAVKIESQVLEMIEVLPPTATEMYVLNHMTRHPSFEGRFGGLSFLESGSYVDYSITDSHGNYFLMESEPRYDRAYKKVVVDSRARRACAFRRDVAGQHVELASLHLHAQFKGDIHRYMGAAVVEGYLGQRCVHEFSALEMSARHNSFLKNHAVAMTEWSGVKDVSPYYYRADYELYKLHYLMEGYSAAEESLRRAIDLWPDGIYLRLALIQNLLIRQRRFAEAEKELQDLCRAHREAFSPYYLQSLVCTYLGRFEEARGFVATAISNNACNPRGWLLQMQIVKETSGQSDSYKTASEEFSRAFPGYRP